MELTNREVKTINAIINDLTTTFTQAELHGFMGSETIKEMLTLQNKILHKDYCEDHLIAYEDMTEEDFLRGYEERMGW